MMQNRTCTFPRLLATNTESVLLDIAKYIPIKCWYKVHSKVYKKENASSAHRSCRNSRCHILKDAVRIRRKHVLVRAKGRDLLHRDRYSLLRKQSERYISSVRRGIRMHGRKLHNKRTLGRHSICKHISNLNLIMRLGLHLLVRLFPPLTLDIDNETYSACG